jgi:hypothetical protein
VSLDGPWDFAIDEAGTITDPRAVVWTSTIVAPARRIASTAVCIAVATSGCVGDRSSMPMRAPFSAPAASDAV